MKKQLLSTLTLVLALILIVPPPALACHIIDVKTNMIRCDQYRVTIWAYVRSGYTLTLDMTVANGSGTVEEIHHSRIFQTSSNKIKTVFQGSWSSPLCGSYDITGTVELRNQCGELEDSENFQKTRSCDCDECDYDEDCDDGNACNGSERCIDDQCVNGQPPDCNDGNICTNDWCDPFSGCQHVQQQHTL